MAIHNIIDLNSILSIPTDHFKIFHTNIRSVNKNFPLLESLDNISYFDVILLTETWTNHDSYIPRFLDFNTLHCPNVSLSYHCHGGVVMYVKPTFNAKFFTFSSTINFQICYLYIESIKLFCIPSS